MKVIKNLEMRSLEEETQIEATEKDESCNTFTSKYFPTEMLESILQHLSLNEHFRFAAVCSSWQSVVANAFSGKRCPSSVSQLPLLIFGSHPDPNHGNVILNLNHGTHKIVKHNWTQISGFFCVGCFQGWLIMADYDINSPEITMFFLNPIISGGTKIMIPPYSDLPEEYRCLGYVFQKVVASTFPTRSDCVVAATTTEAEVVFCRPNDKAWTALRNREGRQFGDIIFHKEKLYALSRVSMDYIVIFDLLNAPRMSSNVQFKVVAMLNPQPNRCILHNVNETIYVSNCRTYFLVEDCVKNELMLVVGSGNYAFDMKLWNGLWKQHYIVPPRLKQIQVLRLDETLREWQKIESLGNRILFLDDASSLCLSTRTIMDQKMNLKKNCICFAQEYTCSIDHTVNRDVYEFSLSDGRFNRIYHVSSSSSSSQHGSDGVRRCDSSSRWFTPTPW